MCLAREAVHASGRLSSSLRIVSIGRIPPTAGLVDQYFNASTGTGDRGEPDVKGPWNEGGDWELVTAPAFQEFESAQAGTRRPGTNSAAKN